MYQPSKSAALIALACSGVALALLAVRVYANLSFAEPLQVQTSGFEQESLYALWKLINNRPVYVNTHAIPYTFSNFNWLFYQFYGTISGAALQALGLSEDWLPTVARVITLMGAGTGMVLCWLCYRVIGPTTPGTRYDIMGLAFALYVFGGPLVGFWALTVRPDVWASVLEVLAVLLFLIHWPKSPARAVIFVLVAVYLAWSFKTIALVAGFCVGLFLLIKRAWSLAAVLAFATLALWLATWLLGTEDYRFSLLAAHGGLEMSLARGFRNLGNFFIKSTPVAGALGALLWLSARRLPILPAVREDDRLLFIVLAACVSFILAFLASFKVGGAENYYFTALFLLSLAAMAGWRLCPEGERPGLVLERSTIAGWLFLALAVGTVLTGAQGVVSMRPMHAQVSRMRACLKAVPGPVFVDNMYLALPWITPGEQHFLLSYYYLSDRRRGVPFELDGIGGLIERGHFGAIVLERPAEEFDRANLRASGYGKSDAFDCGGWTVYLRTGNK